MPLSPQRTRAMLVMRKECFRLLGVRGMGKDVEHSMMAIARGFVRAMDDGDVSNMVERNVFPVWLTLERLRQSFRGDVQAVPAAAAAPAPAAAPVAAVPAVPAVVREIPRERIANRSMDIFLVEKRLDLQSQIAEKTGLVSGVEFRRRWRREGVRQ